MAHDGGITCMHILHTPIHTNISQLLQLSLVLEYMLKCAHTHAYYSAATDVCDLHVYLSLTGIPFVLCIYTHYLHI